MSDEHSKSRYDIQQSLAQGGMGEVLAARDLHFGRAVAMKVIRADRDPSREMRLRFVQEARILSQLEHPNIVPVYDLDKDEQGRVFYTMKKVQGVTLKEVINQLKTGDAETVAKYPLSQLLTVFQKVCDAVAFAHSKGIVHRDLKPENIMLGEYGEVLVLDWGLAKVLPGRARLSERAEGLSDQGAPPQSAGSGALGETRPTHPEAEGDAVEGFHEVDDLRPPFGDGSHDLTLEGTILGTPQFMAPEQAEGRINDIDERTDIFSLGGILYSLLTLRPPTGGTTVKEVLANIKSGYIAPPAIYNQARTRAADGTELEEAIDLTHCPGGNIPDALSAVAMKAMAIRPTERYQTVSEFQAEITAYQGGFATGAEKAGAWRQLVLLGKRNRTASVSALVILLLVGVFVAKVMQEKRRVQATLQELRRTAPTFCDLARSHMEEQKWDEALKDITDALALRPEDADYQMLKGHIHQARLELGEALAAYQKALELRPSHAPAARNLHVSEKFLRETQETNITSVQRLDGLRLELLEQDRRPESIAISQRIGQTNQQLYLTWKAIFDKSGIKANFWPNQDGHFELDLSKSAIKDLSPLKGMPLKRLNLESCTNVSDIRALKGMPLAFLELGGTKVSNLAPLKGMQLRGLGLWGTPVVDLSPLKDMPLETLNLQWAWVKDLTPLRGLPLTFLYLYEVGVSDLTPLKGMPLRTLMLYRTQVKDLSPLEGMPLNDLNFAVTAVTDLRPLRGMPLTSLAIGLTQVSDLTPITGAPLIGLELVDCPKIKDLSTLRGMPLKYLQLQGCTGVRDLGPLTTCVELEYLTIPLTAQNVGVLRQLPKLKKLSYTLPQNNWDKIPPIEEFWKTYDARMGKAAK